MTKGRYIDTFVWEEIDRYAFESKLEKEKKIIICKINQMTLLIIVKTFSIVRTYHTLVSWLHL